MARSITDARQVTLRQFLSQIANAATYAGTADSKPANQAELDNLLAAINDELTPLLRLSASSTPNLIVSVGAAIKANSESSYQRSISHIGALLPNSFTSGTITFPASSGGTITVSPGTNGILTVSSGNFIKILIYMDATGALNVLAGTQNAVEANATVTAAPKKTLPIGYVTLQNVAGVIQNVAQNKIYQFGSGGSSSSGSGSGTGDDLDALLFRASFTDKFDEGPTDSASAVDVGTAKTDSTAYSFANALYQLNYDAAKTIAAGTTTTNINISAVAAFTVKTGDVVIANNQARKITAVASQQSFTTEAFSVAPTLAAQVTVSQAVHTLDIYNIAVDGVALSAAFSGATFQDVLLDYEDTSTSGDAIFDVNTTPVIGASASADGTTFSDVKLRATLETDTMNSFLLPAAGTGLYLRFFANKTSGTGSVNILGYRAFMQKSTVATAGGITNSSYGFSNNVGTPVNATIGVSGGKTTITLPWTYAVGVYPGTSASSIEVWLNGQKLPRFINSTLTPDGSFLETSSNIVTLDSDYSSLNLGIEIFQRTQIVDSSTINTTNIAYQQEIMQNGFQGFVAQNQLMNATSATGAPAAGSFYSSIIGRAALVDLTQDLKPRMGVERIMTQGLIGQVQNEFGPNGEPIWFLPNDPFGQIRLGGTWTISNQAGTYGSRLYTTTIGDFVEITFYGTGLNILYTASNAGSASSVTVNGVAATGLSISASSSGILGARNYAANQVISVVSGLTLGVYTVKIAMTTSVLDFSGLEILNEVSTLKVPPGVSYLNGQKLVLPSLQSPSYNSTFDAGTLGTRGGRVVVYQKADGTIGKAVTPPGSQLTTTSADHSTEEVVRVHQWREFGAGRSDDYSTLLTSASTRGFLLDDGTTALYGLNNRTATPAAGSPEMLYLGGTSGNFYDFIFVGTGLDIVISADASGTNGSANAHTVTIDDGTPINLSTLSPGTGVLQTMKVVSGLPYGSHTVRLQENTVSAWNMLTKQFVIYQPKKPTIPSGAVELADYNILADFNGASQTGAAQADNQGVPTGTIHKQASREFLYNGASWGFNGFGFAADALLGTFTTAASGDFVQYTFFGTGVSLHFNSSTAGNYTAAVNIDGVTTLTGTARVNATTASGTFTTTTGVAGGLPIRVEYTGLTLGTHTIKITKSSGAGNMAINALNIITPIHSTKSNLYADIQNTLPVGSNAISDNRKITPVKDILPVTKAWAKAVGISSAPTTTSTSLVPMPDMSCAIKTSGGPIKISFNASLLCGAGQEGLFQIYVDGIGVDGISRSSTSGSAESNTALSAKIPVGPGVHKVDVYWLTTGGTLSGVTVCRFLLVEET